MRAFRPLGGRTGAWGLASLVVALSTAAPALPAQGQTVACEICHANRNFLVGKAPTPEGEEALYVPGSMLQETAHEGMACTFCHPAFGAGYPHEATVTALPCQSCHAGEGREWAGSIHAANAAQQGDAATCVDCHGTHQIYRADDRRSPTHPLNVASLCGSCHADPRIIGTYFMAPEQAQARVAVQEYYQTVHGTALTRAGLTVAATCSDCHAAHRILPADSAESTVNRSNIPNTCGTCHLGIDEEYETSAHGRAYQANRTTAEGFEAPVCVDCHTSHGIVRAADPSWFIGVVEECGTCHEALYESYFETYHGKVTQLGFALTAKCSDCHTAHRMLPASDPASSVYPTNLVATCAQCHPDANQNFVRYYAHGDPTQRDRFPLLFWPWLFMTALLAAVFSFFGLHTILWLGRLSLDRVRAARAGRRGGDPPEAQGS